MIPHLNAGHNVSPIFRGGLLVGCQAAHNCRSWTCVLPNLLGSLWLYLAGHVAQEWVSPADQVLAMRRIRGDRHATIAAMHKAVDSVGMLAAVRIDVMNA